MLQALEELLGIFLKTVSDKRDFYIKQSILDEIFFWLCHWKWCGIIEKVNS